MCMHKYLNTYYCNTVMPKPKTSKNRVTTSIKVDPNLWKEVKIFCIQNNIEVSELLDNLLRKELNRKK